MTNPSFAEMFRVFGRIGVLSFGGPAAQIALMHRELVERRPWLSEQDYLSALSFCMLLPGPEAMQLATYAGWRQRGIWGGVLAGGLFVLPGAVVILALALCYLAFGDLPMVRAAFQGIQAAVVVIVLMALRKIAARALKGPGALWLAAASFVAIFFFQLPFPLVILAAAIWGASQANGNTAASASALPAFPWRPVTLCLILWAIPLLALLVTQQDFLLDLGLFFSKLAIVTFGGAYAVLAYMTQAVVADHGWLSLPQMIDALGLAETTPGPLILVTQFVGTVAGHGQGGIVMALLATLITLWVTFVPCYLWIFAGAPYVAHLTQHPKLAGAMPAITAAVTGVILNLSVWFALHVLFSEVHQTRFAPVPELSSFHPQAAVLTGIAALLLLLAKREMLTTLAIMALAGITGMILVG